MNKRERLSNLSLLNYIFIAVTLLWFILQSFVAFDGFGRIPMSLTIIVFLCNLSQRVDFSKPPFSYHFVWFLYVVIQGIIFGVAEGYDSFHYHMKLFQVLVVSYVVCKEFVKDGERTLNYIVWLFAIYMSAGLTTGVENEENGRMNFDGGNGFAIMAVPFCFVALLKFIRKEMKLPILLLILAVVIYIPFVCATRKAFAGIGIILACVIVSYLDFKSVKSFGVILLMVLAFLGGRALLTDSVLGARFEKESDSGKSLAQEDNFFTDFVGDRTDQYILGWQLFEEHPFTGIGLSNFRKVTQYSYQLHTEYMVQFAECGIIGVVLFFLYFKKLLKSSLYVFLKQNRHIGALMLGYIMAVLFMCFTAWIHTSNYLFICFGLIMGVYQRYKTFGIKG